MIKKILQASAVYFLVFSSVSIAQDSVKTTFMFWSRSTIGQVVSSTIEQTGYDIPFDKEWLETVDGGLKITRTLTPHLTGRLNLGVVVNVATVTPKGLTYEYGVKKVAPALLDACLEYRLAGLLLHNDSLAIELGYFPFKYNPQSTNLGEYLFRSGTYPGWLVASFEHSIDRPKLAGIHASHSMGSTVRLKQDLIVNSEQDMFPYRDINLSYIATPAYGRMANCGLGVELARLIAVDPRKTTVGSDTMYKNKYDPKIGYIDTATGDTIRYTFKGTKLMGRAMFDIKELIVAGAGIFGFDIKEVFGADAGIFGREDLKIYGEAALLGVKNYPGWYANRFERLPVMAGINWPNHQFVSYTVLPGIMGYLLEPKTAERRFMGRNISEKYITAGSFGLGGILFGVGSWFLDRMVNTNTKWDLIAVEGEYYHSPYVNTQDYIWKGGSPVPYVAGRPSPAILDYRDWNDSMAITDDDIRWSIYASKRIGKYLRLSAQAACDHTPKNWYTPWPAPQSSKYSDVTSKSDDWYFMTRLSMYF